MPFLFINKIREIIKELPETECCNIYRDSEIHIYALCLFEKWGERTRSQRRRRDRKPICKREELVKATVFS